MRCRSIDGTFLQALAESSFNGRVHSLFSRVVNIECETGRLFTLAGSGLDDAPNTAIVDIAELDACGIALNDPVVVRKGGLCVGDSVIVDWTSAAIWHASLPQYENADGSLENRLDWVQSYLSRNGPKGGFVDPDPSGIAFALQISVALQQRSGALLEALEQGQMAAARQHAEAMIGLGPGLTPAGDDFLVGLFAVLNMRDSPCYGWLAGGKDVLPRAAQSTNAISLAALTAAAGGQVRQSISGLIETLIEGTPTRLPKALDRVLAIGSTSGADLVAGILSGLNLNLRIEATGSGNARSQERPPP